MKYLIAIATGSGRNVDRHFGQVSEFKIFEITDNATWREVENRKIKRACQGYCEHETIAEVADALADCKYSLAAKIGFGAAKILQKKGIIPLEIVAPIDYAIEKIMVYDKRKTESNK